MNRTVQHHAEGRHQAECHRHAELRRVLVAYCGGLTADILQAKIDGEWGPIWTIPPCSPEAMERGGRQFTHCRAQAVRHYRRALLRRPSSGTATDVVVGTELPDRHQTVIGFDGVVLRVDVFLEDDALAALEAALAPTLRP